MKVKILEINLIKEGDEWYVETLSDNLIFDQLKRKLDREEFESIFKEIFENAKAWLDSLRLIKKLMDEIEKELVEGSGEEKE